MLSILIPVYNFDIKVLVTELHRQAMNEKIPFEILVLDDASDKDIYNNSEISNLQNVKYSVLTKNIGRSKIRNVLSSKAKFPYLLFLDCDASVSSNSYIHSYVKQCKNEVVVCGGTGYENSSNFSNHRNDYILRLNYGFKRETKTAYERNQNPNNCFSSFNFMISKSILERISFDETITQYGHEDTLFGLELKRNNIIITHIENPLNHIGLDTNSVFISKALSSVRNLYTILNRGFYTKDLNNDIKLLRYYSTLKFFGLTPIFSILYKITQRSLKRNLINKGNNLFYFDMLRLGFLCSLG